MAAKKTVFLTGATGGMGRQCLERMVKDYETYDTVILARDSEKNRKLLKDYEGAKGLTIVWGDLGNYEKVKKCVALSDLVLHVGAFVSPKADYYPEKTMQVNYGSTKKIIQAIFELGREEEVGLIYIGTVAETGDRMPPIHWGRVGDPIKPSMFDYYAVSKVASERLVIESGLKYWASLRQTGIIGPAMSEIRDPIMFHNCFDNVLEYVSDRDSGVLMRNISRQFADGSIDPAFWNHIYNIGGGESCRVSCADMFENLYGAIGIRNLDLLLDPKEQATRNFHGQYYLDSDKLENFFHFRNDPIEYYYDCYKKGLGPIVPIAKAVCKVPGGQKVMAKAMGGTFQKLAKQEHGPVYAIENNLEDWIDAFWGSRKAWEALPEKYSDMEHFTDWDKVILMDHGYDESKPESELTLKDMLGAAEFRGGKCLSDRMEKGDWTTKLEFECAFGHRFHASPRLILEGGHWCDECERKSWNYGQRAKVDPFLAQVWNPLHEPDELREYPKIVSELDVD
ncbi:MAG: NAD(P)-dependent oxidoreductase [Clostridia bacterium]|nr:NAD(P)-dependent oxidoreductase [Clostridia bacterium]